MIRPDADPEAAEAARLIAEAYSDTTPHTTAYRDPNPAQQTGAAPVAQPGRPPMSQRATDHAAVVPSYCLGSLPVGASLSLVLWQLSSLDPATLGLIAMAPIGLVGTIGVAARMISRAIQDGSESLPDTTIHQHTGPTYVQHNELHTDTSWFGTTHNQLPPADPEDDQ